MVFVLRQRQEAVESGQRVASPVHPFYLVYIQHDGRIRYGCANTRQVLEAFEMVAVGQDKPIQRLCDQFNTETDNGRDMGSYNKLLEKVIRHITQRHGATQMAGLALGGGRDFVMSRRSETPQAGEDFDLMTWFIISPPPPSL